MFFSMAAWKTPPLSVTPLRGTFTLWTGGFHVVGSVTFSG